MLTSGLQSSVSRSTEAEQYWRRELASPLPELEALGVPSEGAEPSYGRLPFMFPAALSRRLSEVTGGDEVSLFVFLLAAYKVLLSRLCFRTENWRDGHRCDALVLLPALQPSGSCFRPYIPSRALVDDGASFRDFLFAVRDKVVRGHQHAVFTVKELAAIAGVEDPRRLCRHAMVSGGLHDVEQVVLELEAAAGKLILGVATSDDRVSGFVVYDRTATEPSAAEKFVECYQRVLEGSVADPGGALAQLPLMAPEERNAIDGYSAGPARPAPLTVVAQFERQADTNPDRAAVSGLLELDNIYDPATPKYVIESATYANLNARANQIARALRDHGTGRNDVVGVRVDHPVGKIEAILGVLKAGAAYLPIDDRHPPDLKERILADAQARSLIVDDWRGRAPEWAAGRRILDIDGADVNGQLTTNLAMVNSPDDLCYVCFTSGTTSSMKGVLVEHRGLANYTAWRRTALGFNEASVTLQLVPFSADGFGANVYPTLAAGGTVVSVPESRQSDGGYIRAVLERCRVTNMSLVPSACRPWLSEVSEEHVKALDVLVLAGEVTPEDLLQRWRELAPQATIANEYGPTEATVAATLFVGMTPETSRVVGRPIDNTRVLVLNGAAEPTPRHIPGEICIAGPGVARGYVNDPELTARKFVTTPCGGRLYRTGDLGVWTDGGDLRYLGRLDRQRKLRGHRIDLEYIERRIREILPATEVYVQLRRGGGGSEASADGDAWLVAYVGGQGAGGAGELRQQLARELPDWMVPPVVVPLGRLARTEPGRIDLGALSAPHLLATEVPDPPRTETERRVAEMFERLLRLEPGTAGRRTNFFELGGHSLSVTQLAGLIHSELRANLKLSRIYQSPTVEAIAGLIEERQGKASAGVTRATPKEYYDVSPAQERMYVMRYSAGNETAYNTPLLIDWRERIDTDRLEAAFRRLIDRHEVFRTSFLAGGGRLQQRIQPTASFALERRAVSPGDAQSVLDGFVRPFSLERPPILRGALVRIDEELDVVALDSHHIITDGVSMSIILRELRAFYDGEEPPPLRCQYKDYAEWQLARERMEAFQASERFWLDKFADDVPALVLPADFDRPRVRSLAGDYLVERVAAETSARLHDVARANSTTLSTVVFAAFAVLLATWTGQRDFVVGLSVSGRLRPELQDIVGNFAGVVPLRCGVDRSKTFRDLLAVTTQEIVEAYENQEFSLDRLVTRLERKPDPSRNPMFDVVYQFVHQPVPSCGTPHPAQLTTTLTLANGLPLHLPDTPMFDLVLDAVEDHRSIALRLGYSSALFRDDTARSVLRELLVLLERLGGDSETVLADIELTELGARAGADLGGADERSFRFS